VDLEGHTPLTFADGNTVARADLNEVCWVSHCRTSFNSRSPPDIEFETDRACLSADPSGCGTMSRLMTPDAGSPMDDVQGAFLRQMLASFGAFGDVLDTLLPYTLNPFDVARFDVSSLPLADELHIEAWEDYVQESRRDGVWPVLARRLV